MGGTILVGGVLLVVVILVIRKLIKDKKNGKACGCDCGNCNGGCH